jgi:hypothetical protein
MTNGQPALARKRPDSPGGATIGENGMNDIVGGKG